MMNLMQALSMFQTSQNPMAVMQQISKHNPQLQGLLQNLQGKNPAQLKEYAMNMAQSRGINLQDYLKQFGLNISAN